MDTQRIPKFLPDTQPIKKRSADDRILIGAVEETQQDTQIGGSFQLELESQEPTRVMGESQPTQKVTAPSDTQVISKPVNRSNADNSKSQPQVLNTQEFSNLSLSESPEKDDIEEIHTDNDEEENTKDEVMSYDDSVSNHRLKRRIPNSPRKLKRRNTETLTTSNHLSSSTPNIFKNEVLRQHSVPLVLASPIGIHKASSSPLKYKSIPEEEKSIRTDRIEGDTSNIDIEQFPSSPSKLTKISFDAEHEPSELDELDFDYSKQKDKIQDVTQVDDDDDDDDIEIVEVSSIAKKNNNDDLDSFINDDEEEDNDDPFDETFEEGPSDEPIIPKPRTRNIIDSQSRTTTEDDSLIDESTEPDVLRAEVSEILTEADIINHESVWAIYTLKMYAGMLVAKYIDNSNVDFIEGTYSIKNTDLNLLDIRIGDTLNIRHDRHKYIVTGLSIVNSFPGIRCMRGYNVVHLQRHPRNKSRNAKEITVPLSECFMELSDWAKHQQRFKLIIDQRDVFSKEILPATSIKSGTLSRYSSDIKPESIESQAFQGMLFYMTNIEGERKEALKQTIESNGGILWDKDLYELFQFKKSKEKLYLDSEKLGDFKFIALLTNGHCRKAKYIQTLALGWPIISEKFIDDTIANSNNIHNWYNYLLPSGFSAKLNTIKSSDVFKFRNNFHNGNLIKDQLRLNNNLLQDFNVLVLSNKSANFELMETCRFVFYSFGVKSLEYYTKADQIISGIKNLDNLMIFDESNKIEQVLTNWENKANKKSKSKLISVKLIDWEWVVQCVINETLLESKTLSIHI
ncbi:DNA repair protein RAD9 [Candida tropicalis]